MKNTINIPNNVNLIVNTYRSHFFFKLLLRTFDVVRQLRPCNARRVSKTRQCGNGKVPESAALEIHKP